MIHVEWRNFDTKLVKFPVELSDSGNEADAVFVSQIGSNLLIDTRVFAYESRKESRAARCFGQRPHNIVSLKKSDLIDARKSCFEIQARQLSH